MWWWMIKEYRLFVSLLLFHFTLQQSLYAMCLTLFFFNFKLWDNTLKKEKKGRGGREFKNTTLIGKRKKEKKCYNFFSFYGKLVKQKERYCNESRKSVSHICAIPQKNQSQLRLIVVVNKAQFNLVNTQCGTYHTPTHIIQSIKLGHHNLPHLNP